MLPQFLRKLMPISIVIFLVLTVLWCVAFGAAGALPSSMAVYAPTILLGSSILWAVSFTAMMFLTLGVSLVRSIENAALHSLGRSGAATVQDIRTMIERGRYGGTRITGVRIKLNVHTPEGETFDAVAEDSGDDWQNGDSVMKVGQEVPVKYSPLTKEVVLMLPKHKQVKEPEAKQPDW